MENRKSNNLFTIIAVALVVAVLAYGAGIGTMWLTYHTPATANTGNNQASSTPGSSSGSNGTTLPTDSPAPEDLEKEFQAFWNTFRAVESEYYNRPVDRQKMIDGAAKGMMEALDDDCSSYLTAK